MYRSTTCGALRINDTEKEVTLSGWIQRIRNLGGMTFIDLRDRYGVTQLVFDMDTDADLCTKARKLGREYVIQIIGRVAERSNKNPNMPTGEVEIGVHTLNVINKAEVPPFTIEDESDGGDELRMKYRYLDIRRNPVRDKLILRHQVTTAIREYLNGEEFIEIETPYLIKSTPEGARDFVVPSRLSPHQFYALPQSPQVFKQLLMVGGMDKYYQVVKCFRDEDFRADRQPEFTQIDCEMSFVERDDVLRTFEGLTKFLFKKIKNIEFDGDFPKMTYDEAMSGYGTDRPDLRFDMKISDLSAVVKGRGFKVFDSAEYVGGICVPGAAAYSRKQLDGLIDFVKKPQIGAKGLVYVKCNDDGTYKSSVDKFYDATQLQQWANSMNAGKGDLLLVMSGDRNHTLGALGELRLEMGNQLELRKNDVFAPLWVVDFPLLEWDEESQRFYAMHHPFTAPVAEDFAKLDSDPGSVKANAYDLVINGSEIGGGSIRIFDSKVQQRMFEVLGFTRQEAEEQFGFLMNAFKYGAPPHGGAAFGLDRWVAIMAGTTSIKDVIAFPKNNSGRDIMIDSPSPIAPEQLRDLHLQLKAIAPKDHQQ